MSKIPYTLSWAVACVDAANEVDHFVVKVFKGKDLKENAVVRNRTFLTMELEEGTSYKFTVTSVLSSGVTAESSRLDFIVERLPRPFELDARPESEVSAEALFDPRIEGAEKGAALMEEIEPEESFEEMLAQRTKGKTLFHE